MVVLVPSNAEVSSFAPALAPRVTAKPVVGAIVSSISNQADGVIKRVSRASLLIVNTTCVDLERPAGSIHRCCADTAVADDGLDLVFLAPGGVLVAGDLIDSLRSVIEALGAGDGGVWVILLAHKLVILVALDVLEGVNFHTAITACAHSEVSAVNEVLFGATVKLAMSKSISGLASLDSSESPAGTAVALVFDFVDDASLTPVFRVWGGKWAVETLGGMIDFVV